MKSRLVSLDVLRGFTIILMTIVNNPGDWGHVYSPLLHAEWHGCTLTDLVFPTFLFIVGVSVVMASPQKQLNEDILRKILTRTLRIFCLGLLLNFFSKIQFFGQEGLSLLGVRLLITTVVAVALFADYDKKAQFFVALAILISMMMLAFGGFENFSTVRIPGVLQRIAIVYLAVSILYHKTTWVIQSYLGLGLLVIYFGLMTFVPVPGIGAANLNKGTNLAAWLDNYLLHGHLWVTSKTWDPEGILSTIPAIATGIAGLLTGSLLISRFNKIRIYGYLLVGAATSIAVSLIWSAVFPMNKALWTSSFVLYSAGLALAVLALLYYIIDLKKLSGWTVPFVIFGVNPMFIFFLSGIIPRVLSAIKVGAPGASDGKKIGLQTYLYDFQIAPHFADPRNASLCYALVYLLFWFCALYFLFRNKLVFKV